MASHGMLDLHAFLQTVQEEMAQEPILPEPWISGHDVLACGVSAGPEVGDWLRIAYDAQLEGLYTDREELLEWFRQQIETARKA